MILVENTEIVFNFWYIHDENGIIYSLRAKAYVGIGSNDEKLKMLEDQADLVYLIAQPYPVSENHYISIQDGSTVKKMSVTSIEYMKMLGSPIALFEDSIKDIESKIPLQTSLEISQNPLFVVTPLVQYDDEIAPRFNESQKL